MTGKKRTNVRHLSLFIQKVYYSLTSYYPIFLLPFSAAFEIMVATTAIQHHIREKKTYAINSDIQTGQQLGMKSLDTSLFELYKAGKLDEAEMFNNANKPDEIREKMGLITASKDLRSKMNDPVKPVGV